MPTHSGVKRVPRPHGDAEKKLIYEDKAENIGPPLLQADDIAQLVLASLQMPRTADNHKVEPRPLKSPTKALRSTSWLPRSFPKAALSSRLS